MTLTVTLDCAITAPWPVAPPPDFEHALTTLIAATLRRVELAGAWEVSLVGVSDERMRAINQRHRGIDAATDVLSFPQSPRPLVALPPDEAWVGRDDLAPPLAAPPLGDIVVALPTVARQATAAGHSFWREFRWLVVHGALHLVGYDDVTEPGYRAMVAHQTAVLREFGE